MSGNALKDFAKMANLVTGLTKGLDVRETSIFGESIEYLEAGEGEVIVFVHGFAGSNFQWRSWLDHFKSTHKVIAVTIPDLAPTLNFNKPYYSFRKYAEWLDTFLNSIQIDQCHLVSHCTGSCISAFYSSMYPSKVLSLTMMAPPDIGLSGNSERKNSFDRQDLIENMTVESLKHIKSRTYYKDPFIPGMILKVIVSLVARKKDKIIFLLGELSRSCELLVKRLPLIDVETLIIGGESDDFLSDPDSLRILNEKIEGSKLIYLKECAHFPLDEQRVQCIALTASFIQGKTVRDPYRVEENVVY